MAYRLERAEGGSLPTIVNRYGVSVLAVDERNVGVSRVVTPVFATEAMAERVLSMLNGEYAAADMLQRVEYLLAWWELRHEYGPAVRELRKILRSSS